MILGILSYILFVVSIFVNENECSQMVIHSQDEKLQEMLKAEKAKNRRLRKRIALLEREAKERGGKLEKFEKNQGFIEGILSGEHRFHDLIDFKTEGKFQVIPGNDEFREIVKIIAERTLTNEQDKDGKYTKFIGTTVAFGNYMERRTRENFSEGDITAKIPKTLSGKYKSSGYPDLHVIRIESEKKISFFVEVKIFGAKNANHATRTFYITTCSKITENCPHYTLGYEHIGNVLTGRFKVVDVYGARMNHKDEYSTSNKFLYEGEEFYTLETQEEEPPLKSV